MSTYKELLKEREALELKISTARRDEMASAIAQVRAIMDEYGLTQQEIFPTSNRARSATSGTKVAPKYRDPASGQTWTGRGSTKMDSRPRPRLIRYQNPGLIGN